ncbi:MAG: MFS transporter [Planctomycetota bacterium]
MAQSEAPIPLGPARSLRGWLGINSSTLSLLGTLFLVTAATELWSPLIPQYLKDLRAEAGGREAMAILLVGAYGFYRDALEAINYYAGGVIAGRINTRRSLLLFNVLPLVGLAILATWNSTVGVFLAIPFIFAWDSIAGPATITVVGDSLPTDRRTMAFSLQHILRRVARIMAYLISGAVILILGRTRGVQVDAVLAVAFVLGAAALQFRYMKTASRDSRTAIHRPRELLRRFPPDLRRLLVADIAARWAEGLGGPFIILYCIPILSSDYDTGAAAYQSGLLTIQAVTSMICYVVVGPLASREGLAKKPYINLTFLFFALFPVSVIVLGHAFGTLGLAVAFAIGGMREIGEPARKAMIADLVPPDVRTQAAGLYWSVRSLAVMWASPLGAILWIFGDRVRVGFGPPLAFGLAGLVGVLGAVSFYLRFGLRSRRDVPT